MDTQKQKDDVMFDNIKTVVKGSESENLTAKQARSVAVAALIAGALAVYFTK